MPCWITYTTPEVARPDPREPAPRAHVQRPDPIDRAAVLPVDRDEDRPLRRPVAASALSSNRKGRHTHEVYVNGLSTSLPRDVQDAMLRLIPGLERAEIVRYGYAIEYDYLPPNQLTGFAGDEAGRRPVTAPVRSTARPATKRPPPKGSLPA